VSTSVLESGNRVNQFQKRLTYTVKEACGIIGISRTTLWRAIRKGRLGCYRVGRRVLLSEEHMTGFLKSHEKGTRLR
jgi:excisionase family DNA binding protein